MLTIDIAVFRNNLYNLINDVVLHNETITIVTKKGNAIVMSKEIYSSMIETIDLISKPELLKKIKRGEEEEITTMASYNPNEEW